MDLKLKALIAVFWNAFEMIGGKAVQILILIILARLLNPEEFGIIGLLFIFTEISKAILDSGFTQTLIREKEVTEIDFSTVFYTNLAIAGLLYFILYISAPYISDFYDFPNLTYYSRLLFLTVLINAFSIVQNAILIRNIDFKSLSIRTVLANVLSGLIAIYMAYTGWGVLALIWQQIFTALFRLMFLWVLTRWLPGLHFSFETLRRLFRFSHNLMLAGILDAVVSNIQGLLIGKFYNVSQLGLYSQSKQLSTIPSQTLTSIITNVSYPTFTKLNSISELKYAYKKVIKLTLFFIFPLMIGLSVIGQDLISLLLGEKWIKSVLYFQIFCIAGSIYPLQIINQNLFLALGDSKSFLRVSLIKKVVIIALILLTVQFGVLAIVYAYLFASIINMIIVMHLSGQKIKYNIITQLSDLKEIFFVSLLMVLSIEVVSLFISFDKLIFVVCFKVFIGLISFFGLSYFFKLNEVFELRNIINMVVRSRK